MKDNMIVWKDYYITVDENSFTLYQKKIATRGKNKGAERLSLIGHYSYNRMESLLKRIIHLETGKGVKGYVPLEEYISTWASANEKLTKDLERMFQPFVKV